jgi:hypothetical protein
LFTKIKKLKNTKKMVNAMPYEIPLNVVEILKSTLYLLDHTIYPGKDGKTVMDLKKCITGAIHSLAAESNEATELG